MGTMLDAMRKAGLITEDRKKGLERIKTDEIKLQLKQKWHADWKRRAHHNRYGDISLFEIWKKTTTPESARDVCALCGARQQPLQSWRANDYRTYHICGICADNERTKDEENPAR